MRLQLVGDERERERSRENVEELGVPAIVVPGELVPHLGDPNLVEIHDQLAPCDRRILHRPAAVGGRIFGVEACLSSAQVVGEAASGSVEVEVTHLVRRAPVAERMDDERRRDDERSHRHDRLVTVGTEPDRQLAREHVEEVCVTAMDMGIGAVSAGGEPRPGGVQLVPVGEDLDSPLRGVADDLTAAGR